MHVTIIVSLSFARFWTFRQVSAVSNRNSKWAKRFANCKTISPETLTGCDVSYGEIKELI
jgi:hypothetical protein